MNNKEVMQMALDALNNFDKGNHGMRWQAPVIKALRARLAQPEPAQCDGGQCGIGGYCKECPKPLVKLKEMLEVQGRDGTWNYDHYFHGMYNGMEGMLAVLEGREPVFREAPKKWLSKKKGEEHMNTIGDGSNGYPITPIRLKKEWVGLTDEEINTLHYELKCAAMGATSTLGMYRILEKALKEKNT